MILGGVKQICIVHIIWHVLRLTKKKNMQILQLPSPTDEHFLE